MSIYKKGRPKSLRKLSKVSDLVGSEENGTSDERNGGTSARILEPFFLAYEVFEIIEYHSAKSYENICFLTDLYVKKGWSLNRISRHLGCGRNTVRKKLERAGIEITDKKVVRDEGIKRKIIALRERGYSYQKVADLFNLWKIDTRSRNGIWFAKTIRDSISC